MAEAGQTQFLRCKLVVFDVLTNIMRKYMAPEGISPKAIYNSIMLSKAFKKTLTPPEFDRIQNLGKTGFENFDISLMHKIAKFPMFSMIVPDVPTRNWGSEPSPNENSIGDNIMRIFNRRNELVHKPNTIFLDSEFEDFFDKYLDIGRRAEEHLLLSKESLRSQIRNYKTCCIDKNMEEEVENLSRENEDLKRILFKYQSKDGVNLTMYASTGTQTVICGFQAKPPSEGTSSAELRILGIENPAERAKMIYSRRDDINTDNISINNATNGSLLLFLTIRNSIFISEELIEIEIKKFIDNVFEIADLRCSKIGQCNLILHIEYTSDCSDMEELESHNDLVLHLDIKNSAFETDVSISQTFNQFISNVLTSMNGQPLTKRREVTAILDLKENELAVVNQFGQAQSAIEHKKGKDEYSSENKGEQITAFKYIPEKHNKMRIYRTTDLIKTDDQDEYSRKYKDNDDTKYNIPLLTIYAVVIVFLAVFSNFVYNSMTEIRSVTPLDIPRINSENAPGKNINSELFWGTYRSNLYFGMKTRSPNSPVMGLMWFEQSLSAWQPGVPNIRHWCDQRHNISKYGWLRHDGKNFGIQEIVENTFMFNTSFVKRSGGIHGGDWSARITAMPKDIKKKTIVSFLVYLASEAGDGKLEPVVNRADRIGYINGSSKVLGHFQLKFPPTILSKMVKFSHARISCSDLTQIKLCVESYMTIDFWNNTHKFNSLHRHWKDSTNVVVYQVTAEVPVQFDIVFESLSFHQRQESLTDRVFTREFNGYSKSFDKRFSSVFKLKTKGYDTKSINFAKATLSNLLGEISYFYGSSFVKSKYDLFKKPISFWPSPLYTSIPSRSFFPRGFLWNVGFDNILISIWNSTISEEIIAHWLDLVNIEGWIPREQILDNDARAKTPRKFIIQEKNNANPPTLFLAIQNLVSRNLTNTDFLRTIFPRLQLWLNWINSSHVGHESYSYFWKDRDRNTMKLNPLTSSSGFDDYPRASHPTTDERHLDLRCWIAMAYGVLSDIAKLIKEDWQDYEATYKVLMNNEILDNLHWSPGRQIYSDYGFHTDDVALQNQTRNATTKPKLRFINSFGYVSVFPLMLKVINPESPRLHKVLTDLIDRKLLWTDYGLRSLETTSPFYQKWNTIDDPPYWRGAIWVNMNYLTLSGLYYYSNIPGKYKNLAATIYKDLRYNIVTNVIEEYYRKGYIYEQYNENTGEGQGCHPFSGWSALIVAIMAEQYH